MTERPLIFENPYFPKSDTKNFIYFSILILLLCIVFLRGDLRIVVSAGISFLVLFLAGKLADSKKIILKDEIINIEYPTGSKGKENHSVKINDSTGYFTYKRYIRYRPWNTPFLDWRQQNKIHRVSILYATCIKFPNKPIVIIESFNKNKTDKVLQLLRGKQIKNFATEGKEYTYIDFSKKEESSSFNADPSFQEVCEKIFEGGKFFKEHPPFSQFPDTV